MHFNQLLETVLWKVSSFYKQSSTHQHVFGSLSFCPGDIRYHLSVTQCWYWRLLPYINISLEKTSANHWWLCRYEQYIWIWMGRSWHPRLVYDNRSVKVLSQKINKSTPIRPIRIQNPALRYKAMYPTLSSSHRCYEVFNKELKRVIGWGFTLLPGIQNFKETSFLTNFRWHNALSSKFSLMMFLRWDDKLTSENWKSRSFFSSNKLTPQQTTCWTCNYFPHFSFSLFFFLPNINIFSLHSNYQRWQNNTSASHSSVYPLTESLSVKRQGNGRKEIADCQNEAFSFFSVTVQSVWTELSLLHDFKPWSSLKV